MLKEKKRQKWYLKNGQIVKSENDSVKKEDEDKAPILRGLGLATELGFTISIPIVIGILAGSWLDKKFSTYPKLTLSLILLGVMVGFMNLYVIIKDFTKKK